MRVPSQQLACYGFLGVIVLRIPDLAYPNENYERILAKVIGYFKRHRDVYAIVLTGSLARGKAVEGSCIDMCIFLEKRCFDALASTVKSRSEAYSRLGGNICFHEGELEGGILFGDVRVDLIFTYGKFDFHSENSLDITRDEFETTIGNLFAHSVLLYEKGKRYQKLKQKYLPFYNSRLRKARLAGTRDELNYKIWKTKWLAERGEYLASLAVLLEAQRIFLQYLFIKKRKYPIDYIKWVKEQCIHILRMPVLYHELVSTIDGVELTKRGMNAKANTLEKLFLKYE